MRPNALGLTVLLLCGAAAVSAQAQHPFQDPYLPVEERITNILNPSGTTSRRT